MQPSRQESRGRVDYPKREEQSRGENRAPMSYSVELVESSFLRSRHRVKLFSTHISESAPPNRGRQAWTLWVRL